MINHYKMAKHFHITITDYTFTFTLNNTSPYLPHFIYSPPPPNHPHPLFFSYKLKLNFFPP